MSVFHLSTDQIIQGLYMFRKDDIYFSHNVRAMSACWDEERNKYGQSYDFEADFLSVRKSLYLAEYEVKRTIADFKNEFKNKLPKHFAIESRLYPCNYYSFVCPEGLLFPEDIPSYAGLYYASLDEFGLCDISEIKKPPCLHKRKVEGQMVFEMLSKFMNKFRGEFIRRDFDLSAKKIGRAMP